MLKIVLIIATFINIGCAMPQTQKEANTFFRTSDYVVKKESNLKSVSLKTCESRMREFSKKCLEKKVIYTTQVRAELGATQNAPSSTFRPKIVKSGKSVKLYLQRYAPKLNFVGTPEDGRYEFFAEAVPSKNGTRLFSSRLKVTNNQQISLGNILEDFDSWMKGESKFCPKVN